MPAVELSLCAGDIGEAACTGGTCEVPALFYLPVDFACFSDGYAVVSYRQKAARLVGQKTPSGAAMPVNSVSLPALLAGARQSENVSPAVSRK